MITGWRVSIVATLLRSGARQADCRTFLLVLTWTSRLCSCPLSALGVHPTTDKAQRRYRWNLVLHAHVLVNIVFRTYVADSGMLIFAPVRCPTVT